MTPPGDDPRPMRVGGAAMAWRPHGPARLRLHGAHHPEKDLHESVARARQIAAAAGDVDAMPVGYVPLTAQRRKLARMG